MIENKIPYSFEAKAGKTVSGEGSTTNEVQKSLKETDTQRGTLLETMQLPRGLKMYTMALTQGH